MPIPEIDPEDRDLLLRAAILAPSMHNTQPWQFQACRTTIEVHRDPDRELPIEDPDYRAFYVSVGAVVFNLRVAAGRLGYLTEVGAMPDPEHPLLAAEVRIFPAQGVDDAAEAAELGRFFPLLNRRRTNRMPFEEREIPRGARSDLSDAATMERAGLEWVRDTTVLQRLLVLSADAQARSDLDPLRTAERRRWVGGDRSTDGIPSSSLGPRSVERRVPVRDMAHGFEDGRSTDLRLAERFESMPSIAVLSTAKDEPNAWVAAGQALERVWLAATSHGLAVSVLNQALEFSDMRPLVRDPASAWAEPQVVLRFGYGPEVPPTPRRELSDFLLEGEIR